MDCFGYEICDKLIWTSVKGCRNINTIIKQGIPKINMSMESPSSTLGFGCSPHKYSCYILSEIYFFTDIASKLVLKKRVYWGI